MTTLQAVHKSTGSSCGHCGVLRHPQSHVVHPVCPQAHAAAVGAPPYSAARQQPARVPCGQTSIFFSHRSSGRKGRTGGIPCVAPPVFLTGRKDCLHRGGCSFPLLCARMRACYVRTRSLYITHRYIPFGLLSHLLLTGQVTDVPENSAFED